MKIRRKNINSFLSSVRFKSHKTALILISCCGVLSLSLTGCYDNDDNLNLADLNNPPDIKISSSTLLKDPVVTQHFTASELKQAALDAGYDASWFKDPVCGVTVQHIDHSTTGLKQETTNATGAVMIPDGDSPNCQGARPITLYAHGTTPFKTYNLAALNDSSNPAYSSALELALKFAGQGDIVIAPNYPGYDTSELDYAPYVTYQQSRQMLDGLHAGRLAIANLQNQTSTKQLKFSAKQASDSNIAVSASDKLFITGYSQGGYVAMATAKALDDLGVPATAVSPASGPYAVTAFADSIMSGRVIIGGTIFLPLLSNSYKMEYESRYPQVINGLFLEKYAGAENIFPTNENIYAIFLGGQLPMTQLFQSNPTDYPQLDNMSPPSSYYNFGFDDSNYLFNTKFRADYVADMLDNPDSIYPLFMTDTANTLPTSNHPIRQAFIENDLRDYTPKAPMLLCGGNQDPSVTYDVNADALAQIWKHKNAEFALVDVDVSNKIQRDNLGKSSYISTLPTSVNNTVSQAVTNVQSVFKSDLESRLAAKGNVAYDKAIANGLSVSDAKIAEESARHETLLNSYHVMVAPYCLDTANQFFDVYR